MLAKLVAKAVDGFVDNDGDTLIKVGKHLVAQADAVQDALSAIPKELQQEISTVQHPLHGAPDAYELGQLPVHIKTWRKRAEAQLNLQRTEVYFGFTELKQKVDSPSESCRAACEGLIDDNWPPTTLSAENVARLNEGRLKLDVDSEWGRVYDEGYEHGRDDVQRDLGVYYKSRPQQLQERKLKWELEDAQQECAHWKGEWTRSEGECARISESAAVEDRCWVEDWRARESYVDSLEAQLQQSVRQLVDSQAREALLRELLLSHVSCCARGPG